MAKDPKNTSAGREPEVAFREVGSRLVYAWPIMEQPERDFVYSKLSEMNARLKRLVSNSKDDSNFTFLFKLSYRRNWKSGCPICLSHKMRGSSCICGHSEIAVFRPCGHSMCIEPCFLEFQEHIGSKCFVDEARGFKCPMCRTVVKKTFRGEEVYPPKEITESKEFFKIAEDLKPTEAERVEIDKKVAKYKKALDDKVKAWIEKNKKSKEEKTPTE